MKAPFVRSYEVNAVIIASHPIVPKYLVWLQLTRRFTAYKNPLILRYASTTSGWTLAWFRHRPPEFRRA